MQVRECAYAHGTGSFRTAYWSKFRLIVPRGYDTGSESLLTESVHNMIFKIPVKGKWIRTSKRVFFIGACMKKMIKTFVELKNGHQLEIMLPAKFIVCPCCDGDGSRVNPAVDAVSIDDLDCDPDFKESYYRGDYDIPCSECNGEKVILEVNRVALSLKMLERLDRAENSKYQAEAEAAFERKWGC